MRSATSSANMTVSLRRLPYSSVTVDLSSAASTEAAIDIIGVMPEPAAIRTCWPGTARSGVNVPLGAWTSSVSPALSVAHQPAGDRAAGHLADADPRGGVPAGGADRVGAPFLAAADGQASARRRTRTSPARSSGTANVIAAESSVSGSTRLTVSRWKSGCRRRGATGSFCHSGLHRLERLAARVAAVQRLAGRGAELGGQPGVGRAAARAAGRRRRRPRVSGTGPARRGAGGRRGDADGGELAAGLPR